MNFRIELDLSKHCIETALKKIYNQALSAYFKTGSDKKQTEQVIELSQYALEQFDFAKLRSTYKDLAGGTPHPVVLFKEGDKCTITLDNILIDPLIKI